MRKLTQEEFIEKAKNVHGDDYDYSKSKYNGYGNKLVIICKECGKEFIQKAGNHLNGKGCPYCHGGVSITKEDFIEKAVKVHGNKYDYSKVEYLNNHIKVCIICSIHGEFWQTTNNHLAGKGCPMCDKSFKSNKEAFIKKAIKIHGDIYDYSKVEYVNSITKVCIICKEHGDFWQIPNSHLNGAGCPICKSSHGEKLIEKYLNVNNIKYIRQYDIRLNSCKLFSINRLKVDFYLCDFNTIIEFNGIQHYKYDKFFHGNVDSFGKQVDRDKRLRQYCKQHKINLIEIKYDQIDKIDKILNRKLKIK